MSDTSTSRGYAWGIQSDYQTQKPIAAGALKQLLATDKNLVDYEPITKNDEEWANGANSASDEWIEAHEAKVQHQIPGFSQEMGKVFYLNLGNYVIEAPAGATVAKTHIFSPQDPTVSRQGKAVTYAEKTGLGYNVLMPSAVGDGFTIKGDGLGCLTVDFGLQGSGALNIQSPVVWGGATPTVEKLTGLHKFFNTQVGITPNDGSTYNTPYACRYRSFEASYKQTLLLEAGFQPGCGKFLVDGDPTSGAIRGKCEFDKQMLDFNFNVDMAMDSKELDMVQKQKPINLIIEATGGIIEAAIRHKFLMTIPVAKYKTSKPVENQGIMNFNISGKALFDFITKKLFEIRLTNNVPQYVSAF